MNAQQRRKKKRSLLKNKKFKVGDKVRVNHIHRDSTDTYSVYTIKDFYWNDAQSSVSYILEETILVFQEMSLIHNTHSERRKVI